MPVSVLETSTDTPIAARLNELGHRNWRGESFSPKKVIVVRNAYKLRSRFERLRQRGNLARPEPSLPAVSRDSSISSEAARLRAMKTARKPTETPLRVAPPALSVNIDIDPLVEAVRRHVKLTPQATRLIKGEFSRLFQHPTLSGSIRKTKTTRPEPTSDPVLTTQDAADLVGVSRPYIVARIEAGDIPLHQQVGNQRRVLRSAVLAWHRQEQARRRKALGQLGADLDSEIFAG